MAWFTLATQAYAISMSISNLCMGKDSLDVSIGLNTSVSKPCILLILKLISSQAAQTHYVWAGVDGIAVLGFLSNSIFR